MEVSNMTTVKVTVSGSFHRHLAAIQAAVESLVEAGAQVLSPSDPRVVDSFGPFLFVASDLRRSIRGIQNRHLEAIRSSSFLWLECPDGYVGQSAALELGFAVALGVPVLASVPPGDLTLRQYVSIVPSPAVAVLRSTKAALSSNVLPALLLDPVGVIEAVQNELEHVQSDLTVTTRLEADPVERRLEWITHRLALPVGKR